MERAFGGIRRHSADLHRLLPARPGMCRLATRRDVRATRLGLEAEGLNSEPSPSARCAESRADEPISCLGRVLDNPTSSFRARVHIILMRAQRSFPCSWRSSEVDTARSQCYLVISGMRTRRRRCRREIRSCSGLLLDPPASPQERCQHASCLGRRPATHAASNRPSSSPNRLAVLQPLGQAPVTPMP